MSAEEFYCSKCEKVHRDGDEIEVIRSSVAIGVKCMAHAMWASRHEIMKLHERLEARTKNPLSPLR